MRRLGFLLTIIFFISGTMGIFVFAETQEAERTTQGEQVFLSWTGDPKTTQTITWGRAESGAEFLQYRKAGSESFSQPVPAKETEIGERESFRYEVMLEHLTPGTSYEYRVGCHGRWSKVFSFKTEAENQSSFSALVLGDVQFSIREEDYAAWGRLLRSAYQEHPEIEFALMTGDYVNTADRWKDWNCYLNQATIFSGVPVMTAPGNHETNYLPITYLKLFALPENGPEGAAEEFYSFDYAGCHFISLNSSVLMAERKTFMGEAAWDDLTERVDKWIEEDLKQRSGRWNVVFLHHPAYGVAEDSRLYKEIRKRWVPIFEEAGVDLVLCGHEHVYMRSKEMNGVTYIMGNSGQKRSYYYNANQVPSYVEKAKAEHSVYGILSGDRDSLRLTVYDESNGVIDVWEKDRLAQPPAAFVSPKVLIAVGTSFIVFTAAGVFMGIKKRRNR